MLSLGLYGYDVFRSTELFSFDHGNAWIVAVFTSVAGLTLIQL